MKVQELAVKLNVPVYDLVSFLRERGHRVKNANHKFDRSTASKLIKTYTIFKDQKNKEKDAFEEKSIELKGDSFLVSDLPKLFGYPLPEIMKVFLNKGFLVNINSEIDRETIVDISKAFNISLSFEDTQTEEEIGLKTKVLEIEDEALKSENATIVKRPPIIAVMGHVDHGKTLLIDKIRKSNVVESEKGGITQHIGAYQVVHNDSRLTFLDTPGHEAFTSIRARGAQLTDIVILVVAGDDGVMPQTIEAINHAQAADVQIVVAINKKDKPEFNPDKVKEQLTQYNLVSEEWGGKTVMVNISAKSGDGIDELLEMLTLVSELQGAESNINGPAKSVVIEAQLSAKKGALATVVVKSGTLKVGDFVVVDNFYGKVRAILNDKMQKVEQLMPGDPGEILGLPKVPSPGSILESKKTEKECKETVLNYQQDLDKSLKQGVKHSISLEALSAQADDGDLRDLNIILKADVQGSLEAIKTSIEKIESKDIPIKIIHSSTGTVTENDVMLAKASQGIIFAFNTLTTNEAKKLAAHEEVSVKSYKIIYEILDDIKNVIQGLYKPEYEEVELATLEVRQIFTFSKVGLIAGCYVTTGKVDRQCTINLFRGEDLITTAPILSLKRFKDDVKEVSKGYECGVVIEKGTDIKEGDKLVAFKVQRINVK